MANKEEAVTAKGRRTLLVEDKEGEFKVELDPEDTVTFGPTAPYSGKLGYQGGGGSYSLRVYEKGSKTKLKAVFSGVQAFRDIDIPVYRKVASEEVRTVWKSDEKGYRVEQQGKRDVHWKDDLAALLPADVEKSLEDHFKD